MKKLNMQEFKEMIPCIESYEFILSLKTDSLKTIFEALEQKNIERANWLLVRLLSRKDKIRYAIFAAEKVLVNNSDTRLTDAINAAKLVLVENTKDNRSAAELAELARDAEAAAWSAARYADSAARHAEYSRSAAWADAESAWSAAESVWSAAELVAMYADSAARYAKYSRSAAWATTDFARAAAEYAESAESAELAELARDAEAVWSARSAESATRVASHSARSASWSACSTRADALLEIVNYGLILLEVEEVKE